MAAGPETIMDEHRMNSLEKAVERLTQAVSSMSKETAGMSQKLDDMSDRMGRFEESLKSNQPGNTRWCVQHQDAMAAFSARLNKVEAKVWYATGAAAILAFIASHFWKKP